MSSNEKSTVLPQKCLGPHGLGDPNDRTLRNVEKEVLIPKIMRERARNEKCADFVKEFGDCCLKNSFTMVWNCRTENNRMKDCLTNWYQNEYFQNECTQIYLKERSDYRSTGIRKNTKRM